MTNYRITPVDYSVEILPNPGPAVPLGTTRSWCVCCGEVTPVEWLQVDAPGVPECSHCGATDLTPTNR